MTEQLKLEATVKLYRTAEPTELLGFADLTVAGAFVIKGIRILMGKPTNDKPAGPYLAFPAKQGKGPAADKWFEIVHPITAQARQQAMETILRAYAKAAVNL